VGRSPALSIALVAALALALALAQGCTAGGGASGPLAVELGTGEWEFVPLADGDDVSLAAGAQGGFHIWTSVRADVADPARVHLEITTTTDGSPFEPESSVVDVDMTPATVDGMHAFLGWPARLLHPGCARDHIVHVRARVTDRAGASGEDERDVVVRWDPPAGVDATCE